jgi:elongation factor P
MASTADFRTGMTIRLDGELYSIVEFQHVNPGNWRAFVRTKLKSVKSGKVIENRFRAGEQVEVVRIDRREYQFLYRDGSSFVFMDRETYDQISIEPELIGESGQFIKEGEVAEILLNGAEPIGVELPVLVDLKVTQTVPGVKGNTATGGSKPASVESGATVNVPLFINEGDIIRVDTRTGEYIERVKAA